MVRKFAGLSAIRHRKTESMTSFIRQSILLWFEWFEKLTKSVRKVNYFHYLERLSGRFLYLCTRNENDKLIYTNKYFRNMKRKFLLLLPTIFTIVVSMGQASTKSDRNSSGIKTEKENYDKYALSYVSQLDSTNLRKTLTILASNEFEGRGTGEAGGKKTQNYLADYLKEKGIKQGNTTSYFQNIEAFNNEKREKQFIFNDFNYQGHYAYNNTSHQDTVISADEIIFVGYGLYSESYNDFSQVDISNKVVMMITGEPKNKFGIDISQKNKNSDYFIKKKPKALIMIEQGFQSYYQYSDNLTFEQNEISELDLIPRIKVNELLGNKLLEPVNKTVKQVIAEVEKESASPQLNLPDKIALNGFFRHKNADACNVIGLIEGSDLKDEYVILSAHHDHEGNKYGNIYNGANNNASGVSSLLEIASVLSKAKKEGKGPRRSVVILLTAGKEKGLIGSKYYASNPIFPLNETVACINIEMLGRTSTEYENKGNNYVCVVDHKTQSGNLKQRLEDINSASLQLELDYSHGDSGSGERYFYSFDQCSFAYKGVPSIMLTSGMYADYKKHTDDTELIDFDGLLKRTKLAFLFLWEIVNVDFNIILMSTMQEKLVL
jgi:hypothetical protein